MTRKVKQVICMRTDTDPPMRKGKMVAQGSHASLAFLTRRIEESARKGHLKGGKNIVAELDLSEAMVDWMFNGSFAKICARVDSIDELMKIYNHAKMEGIEVYLITDSGKTEFSEPTVTCLAIGPDYEDKIDPITRHLRLL